MKVLVLGALLFLSLPSRAFVIELETFDQQKLADLVRRLPFELKHTSSTDLSLPTRGVNEKSKFPRTKEKGFQTTCESQTFGDSPVPSSATCTLIIDEDSEFVSTKNDEFRVQLDDEDLASALFDHISYGRPEKDFRSFGKRVGRSFNGKKTFIFDYRFSCSRTSCELFFSKLGLEPK
jgi:hypothetical protein